MATKSKTVSKFRKDAPRQPAVRKSAASRLQAPNAAPTSEATDTSKSSRGDSKMIRDTFTMPAADFKLVRELKDRCRTLGLTVKKSQLIRVGLGVIQKLSDERLTEAVTSVVAGRSDDVAGKQSKKR